MSKILIYGNIVKDIYLKLSEEKGVFERDENGVDWLNLGFNGEGHEFYHQHNVFGGAAVSFEVLEKFRNDVKVSGMKESGFKASENRFILSTNSGATYFVQNKKTKTIFENPDLDTKMIYIDKSASFSEEFAKKILDLLKIRPNLLLVAFAPKYIGDNVREVLERADLIFTDRQKLNNIKNKRICFFENNKIKFGKHERTWKIERTDLMTHLTIYSIAMATVIGCMTRGKKLSTALDFVKINIEKSNLNGTQSLSQLEKHLEDEENSSADLKLIAKSLVSFPKGILAADESGGSIHKKFESMNIVDDERHRRDYRNIFFTTEGLEKYVNGVILFDETARQISDDGRNFVDYLTSKGIIPGIKVDQGLEKIPGSDEKYTKGLEGLKDRLHDYYQMGLRFAKWRAAFEITDSTPSNFATKKNTEILAEYAKDCISENIVPIVEPEVVYDGNYPLSKCIETTKKVLYDLFDSLRENEVDLSKVILKVNMVLAGKKFPVQSTPDEVGKATANVLRECVPKELAGVVFLSGGQDVEQATENLQAVTNNGPFPWPVTFSFARALQDPALFAWKGDNKNSDKARADFRNRLAANCKALKKR